MKTAREGADPEQAAADDPCGAAAALAGAGCLDGHG